MEPKVEQTNEPIAVKQKKRLELPFHIVKRSNIAVWKKILIYAVALIAAMLFSSLICAAFGSKSPFEFFKSMFNGAFGTPRKIWNLLLQMALLLGASMSLIPAFRMKFWNLGGNGQILMGALAAYTCSYWLGGKMPDWALTLLMLVTGVAAGILWAVIPAIFKAFFGTNETLFTLMMNYIAAGIVCYLKTCWIKSGEYPVLKYGLLPALDKYNVLLTILVFFALAILMFIYLRYSKHGYEISVVGESVNTAKYVGIDVKRAVIRTLILSGAIAGLVGFFLIARTGPGISANNTHGEMGFTAIMTSWLANFNPLLMFLSCFFITFIDKGMISVKTSFRFTNDAVSKIVIGLIYFFVIACAFFINYKIVRRNKSGAKQDLEKKFANQVKGVK